MRSAECEICADLRRRLQPLSRGRESAHTCLIRATAGVHWLHATPLRSSDSPDVDCSPRSRSSRGHEALDHSAALRLEISYVVVAFGIIPVCFPPSDG